MDPRFSLIAILQTAFRVVTSPAAFFREMPRTGGYLEPLLFMLVMGFIGASLQAVLGIVVAEPVETEVDTLSFIVMLTALIMVSGFISAAIYFAIWRLMGSQESFETAYRCNAYISALIPVTALFSFIPHLAPAVSIVLSTAFLVIASVHIHRLPLRKSVLVFGILGIIFFIFSFTADRAMRRLATEGGAQGTVERIQGSDRAMPDVPAAM